MPQTEKEKGRGMLSLYFKNFKVLLLTNLIFAVPLAVSVGITALIVMLSGRSDIFIIILPVLLCFPFYAGVTQVTKDIVKGCSVQPLKAFIKGLKNNYKFFIVHGIALYLCILITYFSVTLYWFAAQQNPVLYFFFGLSVIIGIILLFTMYLVPLITVTIDVPLKYIYKNSFLMAFGELPSNLLITFILAAIFLMFLTISLFMANPVIGLVVLGIFSLLIIPVTVSFIINGKLYPKIKKLFKIEDGNKIDEETNQEDLDIKDIPVMKNSKLGSDDEYVFYNGRMIKRSVLNKKIKEQNEKNN